MLVSSDLAKKLAIDLILREQFWFFIYIVIGNNGIIKVFSRKYFESKELFAWTNLVQLTFSSKIQFGSNWSNDIRFGTSTKGLYKKCVAIVLGIYSHNVK
jgi:hypothetical protein